MTVMEMQFCFMSQTGAIDAVFTLSMLHEKYHAEGMTLYISFVDLKIAFVRFQRKVMELAMRNN